MKNKFIYLLSVGHLAVDTAQGSLPALLPFFIMQYGLSYSEAAGLAFANTILASIAQPIFGYYSDKVSKPWFIAFGTILSGATLSGMGFTDSYLLLFLLSMLAGLGSAIFHPEAARLINQISHKNKGKSMSVFSIGGNAGFAVGPIIASLCVYTLGQYGMLIYLLANTLVAGALFYYMPQILALASQSERSTQTKTQESYTNDWKSFSQLSFVIFSRSILFSVLTTFIPIFWITVLMQSAQAGSYALTLFHGLGTVLTMIGGIMADRLGLVKVLRWAHWVMVPSILLFPFCTNVYLATALLVTLGFSIFASYSPIIILGQTYLSKSIGFASGVTLGLGVTMGGIVTPLVGWIADSHGVSNALMVLWIAALGGFIFSYIIKEPSKGHVR